MNKLFIILTPEFIKFFSFTPKVGIGARYIARYESENYQNTNSSILRKVFGKLNLHLDGRIT